MANCSNGHSNWLITHSRRTRARKSQSHKWFYGLLWGPSNQKGLVRSSRKCWPIATLVLKTWIVCRESGILLGDFKPYSHVLPGYIICKASPPTPSKRSREQVAFLYFVPMFVILLGDIICFLSQTTQKPLGCSLEERGGEKGIDTEGETGCHWKTECQTHWYLFWLAVGYFNGPVIHTNIPSGHELDHRRAVLWCGKG